MAHMANSTYLEDHISVKVFFYWPQECFPWKYDLTSVNGLVAEVPDPEGTSGEKIDKCL